MMAKMNVQNPKKSMPRKLPENISKKNPANKAGMIPEFFSGLSEKQR